MDSVRFSARLHIIRKYLWGRREVDLENYTYILKCSDGSLYTGWTNHLEQRITAHQSGQGARYTRSRRPVELVYWERFATKSEAMRREAAIKRMSRKDKLLLICGFTQA
ncbi:MAG: GIY-YIG nuclease family protein [Lachnospiraceae bacterium]|nr:GIY-YIG nuclease family protein [Lachnospiraceae bacterium]